MRSTLDMFHAIRDVSDERLTAPHRHVLTMMLSFRHGSGASTKAHLRGACDPAVRQLASSTALGESTVHRMLAQLRAWGYVSVRHPGHHHQAVVYDIHVPAEGGTKAPSTDASGVALRHDRGPAAGPDDSRSETSRSETSRSDASGVPLRHDRGPAAGPSADHTADHTAEREDIRPPSAPVPADAGTTVPEPLRLILDGETRKSRRINPDVAIVFDAYLLRWRKALGVGSEPQLSPKRRAQIERLLGGGWGCTVERVTCAFDGLFASTFHCGGNETGTKYLDIEQVIRARERVEKFEAMAMGGGAVAPSAARPRWAGPPKQAPAPNDFAPARAWREKAGAT